MRKINKINPFIKSEPFTIIKSLHKINQENINQEVELEIPEVLIPEVLIPEVLIPEVLTPEVLTSEVLPSPSNIRCLINLHKTPIQKGAHFQVSIYWYIPKENLSGTMILLVEGNLASDSMQNIILSLRTEILKYFSEKLTRLPNEKIEILPWGSYSFLS